MQGDGLAVLSECKRQPDMEAPGGRKVHVEWRESGQVIDLRASVDDHQGTSLPRPGWMAGDQRRIIECAIKSQSMLNQ